MPAGQRVVTVFTVAFRLAEDHDDVLGPHSACRNPSSPNTRVGEQRLDILEFIETGEELGADAYELLALVIGPLKAAQGGS